MFVEVRKITFQTPGSRSLKEKRRTVQSIKERARRRHNIAIAEVGLLDSRDEAEIGFACVSKNARHAESIAAKALNYIETSFPIVVMRVERDRW